MCSCAVNLDFRQFALQFSYSPVAFEILQTSGQPGAGSREKMNASEKGKVSHGVNFMFNVPWQGHDCVSQSSFSRRRYVRQRIEGFT